MRHEGFSFYGLRESDEGADTDLIYNFCWPNQSNLLIDSVPLSGHKNDYLIKLVILLNKTGRLSGPSKLLFANTGIKFIEESF